jgi:hypothetical protein
MTSYELSRAYFDWSFENPEKVTPNHTAIYFFAIEHCNRLGWKDKFGFPTQMAMDAIGIKKNQTYMKYFNELVEWGFFKMVEKSKNQYSANIITLQSAIPKNGKALDKAIVQHGAKQTEGTGVSNGQSNSPIDKPITNNHKPITIKELVLPFESKDFKDAWEILIVQPNWKKKSRHALELSLKKIEKVRELVAIKMIENTIAGGWKGLFELNDKDIAEINQEEARRKIKERDERTDNKW